MYSQEEVNEALSKVMSYEANVGMYAPLIKRVSFYIDDEIPMSERKHMREADRTPMNASSRDMKININRDYLRESINIVTENYRKEQGGMFYAGKASLEDEVRNIFIHELNHILCQHTDQGIDFFKDKGYINGQGKGKIPSDEYFAWMMACEIEANRGYGIVRGGSATYRGAVTDDFTYPETKKDKYLAEIYETIYEKHKDELKKDFKKVVKLMKQMVEQAEKEEQKEKEKEGGENKNNNKEEGNKQEGDKGEQQNGGQSEQTEGQPQGQQGKEDHSEGQPQSTQEGKGDGEQQPSGDSSSDGGKEGDSPENQKRQQQIAQALMEHGSEEFKKMVFDPDFDANDEHVPMYDGQQGDRGGVGGGRIDASGKTARDIIEEWKNIYKPEVVQKAMSKLKGSIVGTIARERVSTYSRQARRDSSDGLLKKGTKRGARSTPKILVALDKSGSMNGTTTAQATEALAKIFEVTGRPTQGCWICLHDGGVKMTRPFKQWKSVISDFYPSGGNDFSAVVREANKLGVDVVLNVGDGGDRVCRDGNATKEFKKAGRRWIDVNIAEGAKRSLADWLLGAYKVDCKDGIMREMADLTGEIEIDPDFIKGLVDNNDPRFKFY